MALCSICQYNYALGDVQIIKIFSHISYPQITCDIQTVTKVWALLPF